MGCLLLHFFVLKIKGVNYMLSSWNFIYKYIGPSYVYYTQKIICPSAARSPYGGYFHGSQPQKCENRPYLKNRVPIIGISQKLAWKFSLGTETLLKKTTIETFHAAKMTSRQKCIVLSFCCRVSVEKQNFHVNFCEIPIIGTLFFRYVRF